jgi:hypothetical protein
VPSTPRAFAGPTSLRGSGCISIIYIYPRLWSASQRSTPHPYHRAHLPTAIKFETRPARSSRQKLYHLILVQSAQVLVPETPTQRLCERITNPLSHSSFIGLGKQCGPTPPFHRVLRLPRASLPTRGARERIPLSTLSGRAQFGYDIPPQRST